MEGDSSNPKNVEIKKQIVEQEEDHKNVPLDELLKDFDLNYPESQINEVEEKENNADLDLNHPEPQINEQEQENNADTMDEILNEFDSKFQELQINEQEEIIKEKDQDSYSLNQLLNQLETMNINESTLKLEADDDGTGTEWKQDPLDITEQIVVKYRDFIHEIYQMLKDEKMKYKQKDDKQIKEVKNEWKKWEEIVERAKKLVGTLDEGMSRVAMGMERMKCVKELKEEYSIRATHVPDLIAQLGDINSRMESSHYFRLQSYFKNRKQMLRMCLDELRLTEKELTEMVGVTRELKALDG